jgi:type II secretory pathway component PulK
MNKRNPNVSRMNDKICRANSGVALFASLALLLIFALLGTEYVRYMTINLDRTRFDVQKVRASHLSQGGVYATIGEMEVAFEKGETPRTIYQFGLQVYRTERTDVGRERVAYPQVVTATVRDESGRVNLNHAPEAVLVALGIPKSVISAMRADSARTPLVSVDDLRTRDYMNSQDYNGLNTELFTVYTGSSRGASVNLNSATPAVLAAIFNIELTEAKALAGKRPFNSWQDVVSKVGREPSTFNVQTKANRSMPDDVSLESNCYRILSEAFMFTKDTTSNGLQADVEAIVQFRGEDGYAIRYWSETPPDTAFEWIAPEETVTESDAIADDADEKDNEDVAETQDV